MKAERRNGYTIRTTEEPGIYEGIRKLWCEVFGDSPAYVDAFYRIFAGSITGYAVVDEAGSVRSALTCYRSGTYETMPVYTSYAVCTAAESRGLGMAAALVTYVRDEVIGSGGLSLVSPAEPSLGKFYEDLGYRPHFYAAKLAAMSPDFDEDEYDDFGDLAEYEADFGAGGDPGAVRPALAIRTLRPDVYGRYREAFLSARPHVEFSPAMLDMLAAESAGGEGLFEINGGDAVCAVAEAGVAGVVLTELIASPMLLDLSEEIGSELAAMLAKHFGAAETVFTVPGPGRCQSMLAGELPEKEDDGAEYFCPEPYYGFPID